MLVSVVIPVRGDAGPLAALLATLPPEADAEIIVSAGGDDVALAPLRAGRPDVRWVAGDAGRGVQLNRGAAVARGRWLWFVHADCLAPAGWIDEFRRLDRQPEVVGGSFQFALASPAWQARVLEWAVRGRVRWFDLPYGDQGLFVRRRIFEAMGGFAPLPLMEDVEFVRRLRRQGRLRHLSVALRSSARRWERDGWVRRSARNLTTLALYGLGVPPTRLAAQYDRRGASDARP